MTGADLSRLFLMNPFRSQEAARTQVSHQGCRQGQVHRARSSGRSLCAGLNSPVCRVFGLSPFVYSKHIPSRPSICWLYALLSLPSYLGSRDQARRVLGVPNCIVKIDRMEHISGALILQHSSIRARLCGA